MQNAHIYSVHYNVLVYITLGTPLTVLYINNKCFL